MIITKKFLLDNTTVNGAWTRKQVEALGVVWPPTKGWHDRLIGQSIPDEKAELFVLEKSKGRGRSRKPVKYFLFGQPIY